MISNHGGATEFINITYSRIDNITSVLEGYGGAASSGETDAAVLPRWCGHCRERSLSHRTLRREHQTVRASILTNKQRVLKKYHGELASGPSYRQQLCAWKVDCNWDSNEPTQKDA
ncbi:hypothetical protein J6590_070705 [Homalodisca vitripennis]|nr:hypothetical protein J6590_070705 [Homalodisca vitripennis]